eukprot:TRINITY_DN1705_c0_g1_i7.p1 TRINITY_DN1705_c0_g1~~TRINITY_DN1705_c0_g1_i7.p1  ORF type:complete len:1209 (-),score=105.49 TRINITY_DN1705_c0_g1_i7:650-3769(-)
MYALISLSKFTDSMDEQYPGSSSYFVQQASGSHPSDFVMNEDVIDLYEEYVKCILQRDNTISGIRYADDPTIMGWTLSEGISCAGDKACIENNGIAQWVDRVSALVKEVDPNHLITIGEDGFYNDQCSFVDYGINANDYGINPNAQNRYRTGQNSLLDHSSINIDFVSFSYLPDQWIVEKEFSSNECESNRVLFEYGWFQAKIQEAMILGKPAFIFSTYPEIQPDSIRNPWFEFFDNLFSIVEYDMINGSQTLMGSTVGGINFGFNNSQSETWVTSTGAELIPIEKHASVIQIANENQTLTAEDECIDDSGYPYIEEDLFQNFTCGVIQDVLEYKQQCIVQALEQLPQTSIIVARNGTFEDDKCQKYNFVGLDTKRIEDMMLSGSLQRYLEILKEIGITVIRFVAPIGSYDKVGIDEERATRLDDLLNRLAFLNMKAIIYFANNVPTDQDESLIVYGNETIPETVMYFVDQVNEQQNRSARTAFDHDDFFARNAIKKLFQSYIEEVLMRTNTVNGRNYSSDPTILAWNLVDDAHCISRVDKCLVNTNFGKWVAQTTQFMNGIDENHMIAPGTTGFYKNPCWRKANPGQWASSQGPDAIFDDGVRNVDYVGFDYLPDDWEKNQDYNFTYSWIDVKEKEALELNMPLVLQKFGKLESTGSDFDLNITDLNLTNYRLEFIDTMYRAVLHKFVENLESDMKIQGLLWTDWDFDRSGDVKYIVPTNSSTWKMIEFYTGILNRYLTLNVTAEVTEECIQQKNATQTFVKPARQSEPSTCCDNDCGAMFGYLEGENYRLVGYTPNAQICCDSCLEDEECEGWTWCSCENGCQLPDLKLSYSNKVCLLKKLSSPLYAMNLTDGLYGSWLAGIPLRNMSYSQVSRLDENGDIVRNFVYHSECQVGGTCGNDIDVCSDRQIENNIVCPSDDCNAEQVKYETDILTSIDLNSEVPGVPITTVDQCCQACKEHNYCNVYIFCNSPYGCATDCPGTFDEDFGPYRQCQSGKWPSWQCQLKYYNGTGKFDLVEAGELQPWISGYLDWKEIPNE